MAQKAFDQLGVTLSEPILKTLKDLDFQYATPIQAECIPHLLKNKDVAAEAVTGSGKTLGFVIPLLELIMRRKEPLKKRDIAGLIISPTRELATQTYEVLSHFLANMENITSLLIVGGNPITDDVEKLRSQGGHIITATPGRLEELLTKNFSEINLHKSLKGIELLILDEADKLLDLGFEKSLNNILHYLPSQRRTGLFSATQTKQLLSLVKAGLRNPVLIEVKEKKMKMSDSSMEDASTPMMLQNYYMMCEPDKKLAMLVNFITEKGNNLKYMLFLSSCAAVDYFLTVLETLLPDVKLFALHGKMKDRRYKIFEKFRKAGSGVLLCTDVMARGVDIPEVHWVIQYDAPSCATSFVHRCGRTARIGKTGNAVVMLMPNEDAYVNFILRNQKVLLKELPAAGSDNFQQVVDSVRQLQIGDRQIFDKANRAFVSYIQSYSKHECNLILRVKDLDICKLAFGFGLLKLPRMPELKNVDTSQFTPVDIDFNAIKYLNKAREKKREENLKEYQETGVWPGSKFKSRRQKQTIAWSEAKQKKLERKERRLKRKELKKAQSAEGKAKKKKRKNDFTEAEMEELMKDVALLKKYKKRKVTDEEFNAAFGDDDVEVSE